MIKFCNVYFNWHTTTTAGCGLITHILPALVGFVLKNYTIQMKNYKNYANGKLQKTFGNYTMQTENYTNQMKGIKYRLNTIIQYK